MATQLPPQSQSSSYAPELQQLQTLLLSLLSDLQNLFHMLPGSAIVLRYIKSSYQNDPVRSGIELILCLFALRYLLAPAYSTQKAEGGYVRLSDEVCKY
jgi:serine palmitoyltransferase